VITGSRSVADEEYQRLRPRLFGIAYRILGSVAEAEDVLQDVWVRWQDQPREEIRSVEAFLTTMTTRMAINVAQSARKRRERYLGPWLPEPVDTSTDPALGAERAEALETAVLLLLERLTPTERAAYVLHEAFGYPYDEIGRMLERSAASSRQLVSRARKHLSGGIRARVDPAKQRRLLEAFLAAARAGDLHALESLLAEDAISYSDGGGRVGAAKIPVVGRTRVARFISAFADRFWAGVTVERMSTNGHTAVGLFQQGRLEVIMTVSAGPNGIDRVLWQMNPAKLSHLGPSGG